MNINNGDSDEFDNFAKTVRPGIHSCPTRPKSQNFNFIIIILREYSEGVHRVTTTTINGLKIQNLKLFFENRLA